VQVSGLSGVTAIGAGNFSVAALKSDGTVWTWGDNSLGQLGNGTTTNSSVPVQVKGLTNVKVIASGIGHVAAIKSDNTVWSWGTNYCGALGNGSTVDYSSVPVQATGLNNAASLTAGANNTMSIDCSGVIWGWGSNWYSVLCNGTTTNSSVPVKTTGITLN